MTTIGGQIADDGNSTVTLLINPNSGIEEFNIPKPRLSKLIDLFAIANKDVSSTSDFTELALGQLQQQLPQLEPQPQLQQQLPQLQKLLPSEPDLLVLPPEFDAQQYLQCVDVGAVTSSSTVATRGLSFSPQPEFDAQQYLQCVGIVSDHSLLWS